mmetsp:Transcript_840/g.1726  ORF Transcript_840/g.1726 Transcript_840/m.1726 type:complete len:208 (-) Transcript_840:233-856(-)
MLDLVYAHSIGVSFPSRPLTIELPRRAPAYAIESVALPFPPLAFTTSVPASWTFLSMSAMSPAGIFLPASLWLKRGRMVVPAWPPITGMSTSLTSAPTFCATNLLARTTSRVVTPTILRGSRPAFSHMVIMAGTTEFTGFTISATTALGQYLAQASTRPLAMSALTFNRSARVMPGLRGIPAGIMTSWQPVRHSWRWSIGFWPTSIT